MDFQTATLNLAMAQSTYSALCQVKTLIDASEQGITLAMSAAATALQDAQKNLNATSTVTIGPKSTVTTRSETERTAGQSAAIDYIKANPACLQADAVNAWTQGATSTIPPGLTKLLNDPNAILEQYSANLVAAKAIPDTTWASFRDFVVATDKTTLMGM